MSTTWRNRFKVHPAADVFPMMSDDELAELGEDIKANGLQSPIICQDISEAGGGEAEILLDGRNRLEAMERSGQYNGDVDTIFVKGDPVSVIISANIHRRHLTKQQQASLIVEVHAVGGIIRQHGEKIKRGRPTSPIKAAAMATAKEHGISKRTVERAFAHYEQPTEHPNAPKKLRAKARRLKRRATLQEYSQQLARLPKNIEGARRFYLQFAAKPDVDLDEEMRLVVDALQNISGKRDQQRGAGR